MSALYWAGWLCFWWLLWPLLLDGIFFFIRDRREWLKLQRALRNLEDS